jgi:uncharacterized protein (DUF1697 family)
MTTYVALLRAVNLGSHNKVGMADVRALFTALGMDAVQTLLQSGNVVFRGDPRGSAELERLLEGAAATRLGLATDILVRSSREWKAIVLGNPFPREADEDPSHLVAMPLKDAPVRGGVAALRAGIVGREVVNVAGRCAYVVYPDGIGHSRLTTALIETKLGTRGTGRNWNTVLKLEALIDSLP